MRLPSPKTGLTAFALALAVALAGCASNTGGSRPPGASADRIIQEEFLGEGDVDALEAIRRLRPAWLRVRNNVDPPIVYLNNSRWGSLRDLSSLRAAGLSSAERLNAADATTQYGTGHTGGAILLMR